MTTTSLDSCFFFKPGRMICATRDDLESSGSEVNDGGIHTSDDADKMDGNIAKSTYTKVSVIPDGLVALQVDDSLICGSAAFLQVEEERVRQFECKRATKVVDGGECVTFNGADLYLKNGVYHLSLFSKCEKIDAHVTIENFISQRALAAYIAIWARPRLLGRIQILCSSAAAPSPKNVYELQSILQGQKTLSEELLFRPLDLANGLRVVCFTDSGFALHADDFKSQLGFVIAIVDTDNRATVVAYGSRQGRRVTRSVLAIELFALVEGFDTPLQLLLINFLRFCVSKYRYGLLLILVRCLRL
jgi:hypothetical protein